MVVSTLPCRLSVVVPTHDTRELTLHCLASIAAADDTPEQTILVDDASSDGTAAAAAARFPALEIVRAEEPLGFTRAANLGLERAAGEILLLLNSDTEVRPGALAALCRAFAAEPELGIVGATLRYPDGRAQWSGGPLPGRLWLFAVASRLPRLLALLGLRRTTVPAPGTLRSVGWVTGAALAMRREVWQTIGPLDTRFHFYAQDLDLCARAVRSGWRIAVAADVAVVHHHGATLARRGTHLVDGTQPALLWCDLLRWAAKARGPRWTRGARRCLVAGAVLRIAGRRLVAPFLGRTARADWARGTDALAGALAELRAQPLVAAQT